MKVLIYFTLETFEQEHQDVQCEENKLFGCKHLRKNLLKIKVTSHCEKNPEYFPTGRVRGGGGGGGAASLSKPLRKQRLAEHTWPVSAVISFDSSI